MQVIENLTVAEIASKSLAAVRVFETLGIDYCCGGKRALADACRAKGYDPSAVQQRLDEAVNGTPEAARDWTTAPLQELIDHIVNTHHAYLKRELPAIGARLEKVYRVYNQRYGPTLPGLPEVFAQLRAEMETHLQKEEMVLFPAIAAYEAAMKGGSSVPQTPFGKLGNPIAMMEQEHESAGDALTRIREITQEFHVPEYGCVTYRALMSGLKELEQDLHMHVHLENNLLFPRALQLETLKN
jgi:regulator of cell morphogenesis and NO signaling